MKRTPDRRVQSNSGAPIFNRRACAPGRQNKRSLPEEVLVQLIIDCEAIKSRDPQAYVFPWREAYADYNRDKVRKKFYCYRDIKCLGAVGLWDQELKWALERKKSE